MCGRRALIIGIGGQDGSYLAELLLGEGYEVVGMVRESEFDGRPFENLATVIDRVTLLPGELLDTASLRRVVGGCEPDELYHLAAPTFVPASWEDPTETMAAIAGSTGTFLALAKERDFRLYVAGSSEVFGDSGESPQHEGSPMRPRSPYGVAKLAALGLVRVMRERHGVHASYGILYNHESPRRPQQFLPRKVTRGAVAIASGQQETLELGSLHAVRDWCHARDVVRAAALMLRHDEPGEYVIASGVARTVGDLVHAAFAAAGISAEGRIKVNPDFVRPPEATAPVGDPSRARDVLGWECETSFEALIAEMVAADRDVLDKPWVRARRERSDLAELRPKPDGQEQSGVGAGEEEATGQGAVSLNGRRRPPTRRTARLRAVRRSVSAPETSYWSSPVTLLPAGMGSSSPAAAEAGSALAGSTGTSSSPEANVGDASFTRAEPAVALSRTVTRARSRLMPDGVVAGLSVAESTFSLTFCFSAAAPFLVPVAPVVPSGAEAGAVSAGGENGGVSPPLLPRTSLSPSPRPAPTAPEATTTASSFTAPRNGAGRLCPIRIA